MSIRAFTSAGSAKTTDRSQLQNLLTYCRHNKGRVHFVVVFNLTRFARDKYDHFALRSHLQSLGISLRSATEPIDDTSTGKLTEGVLAAFAQFDNDCRSDRTRAGMKAALELGRRVFLAPIGYINAPRAMGKSLMADPERAPLVRRAFEEYGTGRFTKQQLLKRAISSIQAKLDRLDEAFLFQRAIDIDTYDRHAEKLRQELTLLRMDPVTPRSWTNST